MNNKDFMYGVNLERTVKASAFSGNLSTDQLEALIEFYEEIDQDLNSINVDNDIVNGLYILTIGEFHRDYTVEEIEDLNILHQSDTEVAFWN